MVLVNEFSEFGSNNNLSEVYDSMMTLVWRFNENISVITSWCQHTCHC